LVKIAENCRITLFFCTGGETHNTSTNTFAYPNWPSQRIDYIMYRSGPGVIATTESCHLPLPSKAPSLNW
jgi:hypothetical protein